MKQVYFVFFELNIFAIRDIIELLGLEVDIMSDMYCPKCKTLLNNDEKASGKCFNCGASFQNIVSIRRRVIFETKDKENAEEKCDYWNHWDRYHKRKHKHK